MGISRKLSFRDEQGDTSLVLTVLVALSMGTAVYYSVDKVTQSAKQQNLRKDRETAEIRNLAALSQATALMSYSTATPSSSDPSTFPYIYPDPYFNSSLVTATRTPPNVATWTFQNMNLGFQSAAGSDLKPDDFERYVTSDARPQLTAQATVNFRRPIYDSTHPLLIRAYEATVTTPSFQGQTLTSRGEVAVPAPQPPSCTLTSQDGQTRFQPNTPMTLVLRVSGVATQAMVPERTENLGQVYLDTTGYGTIDLLDRSNSIRKVDEAVYTWVVATPRPLFAVDGNGHVSFRAYAYLSQVNMNSNVATSCSFDFQVSPPATCKLWVDRASVPPGQCVNVTSTTTGPVQAGSLQMTAEDPTGMQVPGMTQTSATAGTFCTPPIPSYDTGGVTVPPSFSTEHHALMDSLTVNQKRALFEELQRVGSNLSQIFGQNSILLNLSIAQYNAIFDLSETTLDQIASFDFSTVPILDTLTQTQKDQFIATDPDAFDVLSQLQTIQLDSVSLLSSLTASRIATLQSLDSQILRSYVATLLNEDATQNATPVTYAVNGSVRATDGSTNTCLVQVTVGSNECPLFGSQFPNYGVSQTLSVVAGAYVSNHNYVFYPRAPNWEVSGTASSPTQVEPCPSGARCFALDWGGMVRTPFVVVRDAASSNCSVTTNLRQSLGCFDAATKIRMADGNDRRIDTVKVGDQVYNPLTGKNYPVTRITQGPEKRALLTVVTDEGSVQVTSKHPFLLVDGIKTADALVVGDRIATAPGRWGQVRSLRLSTEAPRDWVWNLEIAPESTDPKDHALLANGVVTGDLWLQEKLAQDALLAELFAKGRSR
jgi:hypothetical protein